MVASIGKILSSVHGVAYYERDGHHARGDPAHREASAWVGRGAAALGLSGAVDRAPFKAVLEGRVPGGPRLGRRDRHGNVNHRPGRDITLSAPKSVSLLALVGGDGRIVAAHEKAVRATLEWIESNAIETRLKDRTTGAIVRAGGQSMVAATFRHDTSRNLDPQLHTHCVVANMVRCPEGKWRTMVNDGLYNSKLAVGAIYRAALARGLRELGYRLDRTHADGRFEIAGVARDFVRAFSTRRAEIEAALAGPGPGGLGARPGLTGLAALVTRSGKRDTTREEARRAWSLQAKRLGFRPAALITEAQARRASALTEPESAPARAAEAVRDAVRGLGERDVVFPHAALLVVALGREPGAVTVTEAETAIRALRADRRLFPAEGFRRGPHWTYDPAIAAESESIAWMRAGLGAARALLRLTTVGGLLRGSGLFRKRREALAFALASGDRVIGLQGFEGSGKAPMLDRLRAVAETAACQVIGLALSDPEARALQRASGITSESLPHFLARHALVAAGQVSARVRQGLRASFDRTLQVVDRASHLSSAQMCDLLRVAASLRVARLVLLGDGNGSEDAHWGGPFTQLLRAGMPAAVMTEADRRREADWSEAARTRLAVAVRAAFAKLSDHVSEVPLERLAVAAAALWLALPATEREATAVLAQSPALRQEINAAIRSGLVREGAVSGPAWRGRRLVPVDLSRAALADPASYLPGDTAVFLRPYKRLGVGKGSERTVAAVDADTSVVYLTGPGGRVTHWKPGSLAAAVGGVEVFRDQSLELRAGDRVRWTHNDLDLGISASLPARVEAVGTNRVRFRLEDGRIAEVVDPEQRLRHLEWAWASLSGTPRSRAAKNVIVAVETNDPRLAAHADLYRAVGSVPGWARLVSDNTARLADLLEGASGERPGRS